MFHVSHPIVEPLECKLQGRRGRSKQGEEKEEEEEGRKREKEGEEGRGESERRRERGERKKKEGQRAGGRWDGEKREVTLTSWSFHKMVTILSIQVC